MSIFNKYDYSSNYVEMDERFLRPSDVPVLLGSHKKATEDFLWTPVIPFDQTIEDMLESEKMPV